MYSYDFKFTVITLFLCTGIQILFFYIQLSLMSFHGWLLIPVMIICLLVSFNCLANGMYQWVMMLIYIVYTIFGSDRLVIKYGGTLQGEKENSVKNKIERSFDICLFFACVVKIG